MLQETHCETEKQTIPEFTLAAHILNKQHDLATFVRQDIEWCLETQSEDDSQLEWLAVKFQDVTIISVYKPPPTRLTRASSLSVVNHSCIYAGNFNCHHTEWGYSKSHNDGTCLVEWASTNLTLLYNSKEPDSFHSACWNSGTNPDLAFASSTEDQPSPTRRVLEKFPRSQHWPSLITPVPLVASTSSKPVRQWNFRKADWDKFKLLTNKATRILPPLDNTGLDIAYKAFCSMLTNAAKQSVPRGYQKNYIPCWDEECQ